MRVITISLIVLSLAGLAGCASEAPSGAPSVSRHDDRLDPVNAFPQTRGPYMRQ
jgi:hypothetical protein